MIEPKEIVFILLVNALWCSGAAFPQSTKVAKDPNNAHSVSTNIPVPKGPHSVGTSVLHFTDTARKETVSDTSSEFRELMIQIWYPSEPTKTTETFPYIPDQRVLQIMKEEKYYGLDSNVIDEWKTLKTNSVVNAPILDKKARFPLLLFSHGLGVSRSHYTMFAEELASFGFIVITIDHPFSGVTILPNSRPISISKDKRLKQWSPETAAEVVEDFAKDALFILNQLSSGKLSRNIDPKRIGMLGHSIGGASALEVCRIDRRFKACANLDGAPFGVIRKEGVKKPSLIMRSNPVFTDEGLAKNGKTRAEVDKFFRDLNVPYDLLIPQQKGIPTYIVKIRGTGHLSFSDTPFFKNIPSPFGAKFMDGERSFLIASDYLRAFFDKYLNGRKKGILDETDSPYPEVTVRKYNP